MGKYFTAFGILAFCMILFLLAVAGVAEAAFSLPALGVELVEQAGVKVAAFVAVFVVILVALRLLKSAKSDWEEYGDFKHEETMENDAGWQDHLDQEWLDKKGYGRYHEE